MTTFADSLKKEIARISRKELREEIAALRKASSIYRSDIADLKKLVKDLQRRLGRLEKGRSGSTPSASPTKAASQVADLPGKPGRKVAFSAERLKAQRAKLGFTQEQMARLLGVSSLSIWKWESGGAAPRASRVPTILKRLAMGKREALALLEADVA